MRTTASSSDGPNEVTLPRWLIVLFFGMLTAAGGAFLRLDAKLGGVETRLSVIEAQLDIYGIAGGHLRRVPAPGVQLAPPADAATP